MRGRWGLAAGAALLLAVNALVLAGVARNRTAPPDSQLVLSERELALDPRAMGDDTDRSLRLVIASDAPGDEPGVPWLDHAKLVSLGFDVRVARKAAGKPRPSGYRSTPPRPVLLVLELEGPAYRRALARTAARFAALQLSSPGCTSPGCAETVQPLEVNGRDRTTSRLFAVDAGLDAAALRRRYPDRAHYAIVAGEVHVAPFYPDGDKPATLRGWVRGARIDSVDVPLPFKRSFEALAAAQLRQEGNDLHYQRPPFRATVAWGRRLEPWIVDLTPLPAAAARTTPPAPPAAR